MLNENKCKLHTFTVITCIETDINRHTHIHKCKMNKILMNIFRYKELKAT